MESATLPASLREACVYFYSEERSHAFLVQMRWPDGVCCAHCQSTNVGKMVEAKAKRRTPDATDRQRYTRRLWNCKACKRQFTAKTGTIFEDSALPLGTWLPAVWMICNAKNGISSCELARSLRVTQKSAWFMLHRIRLAMRSGGFALSGEVEADEAFIGGKVHNMHAKKRRAMKHGFSNKTQVVGVLERSPNRGGSKVLLEAMDGKAPAHVTDHVVRSVKEGSKLYTDAAGHYSGMKHYYDHEFIDHAITYVKGKVHTNGLENFWSLLKRTLRGTYVHVSPMHLFRYLDEQTARFNERLDNDADRFVSIMQRVSGRRLPYVALTNIGLI